MCHKQHGPDWSSIVWFHVPVLARIGSIGMLSSVSMLLISFFTLSLLGLFQYKCASLLWILLRSFWLLGPLALIQT